MANISSIVTVPPYSPFTDEVLSNPFVSGIRLNTVMPLKETCQDALKRLKDKSQKYNKDFYIDLKARQLRIKEFGTPPYTPITLSHEIDVFTPCKAYFSERDLCATILEVKANHLIMQEGPKRLVGPGESVTIPHPTLRIKGFLTDTDKQYIDAANKVGLNKYMLSFVEKQADIKELLKYSPNANITAKIESEKGVQFIENCYRNLDYMPRLMAARGDLYMELKWPHQLISSLETILNNDKNAIVASRIFSSLKESPEPSSADVFDADCLLRMGYKTFMFGDEICFEKDKIMTAINLLAIMARKYEK